MLFELCLRPFFYDSAYILVTDWANDAVYLSLFIFGYVFASDERIPQKLHAYDGASKILVALSLGVLFYVNIQSQVLYHNADYLTVLWVFAKGVYESAAIVFLVNLGARRFNRDSGALRYLSGASFPVYIIHFLPVTFFTLVLIQTNMPNVLKFLLTIVCSYATVFLLYECWRRMRLLLRRGQSQNARLGGS